MSEINFNKGDIVKWTYTHWVNRKSCTTITKTGTFLRYQKSKNNNGTKAVIKIDGNKRNSIAPVTELKTPE